MMRGRTFAALPLLGLGFLVFAGVFGAPQYVKAQGSQASSDIGPLLPSDVLSLFKACGKNLASSNAILSKYKAQALGATTLNDFMDAYDQYVLQNAVVLAGNTCTSSLSISGKSFSISCTGELGTRTGGQGVCRIKAPDGSTLVTTGNIGGGWQYTKIDSSGIIIGNADAATGLAVLTSDGDTGVAKDQDFAAKAGAGGDTCSFYNGDFGDCLTSILGKLVSGILWIILGMVSGILGLANYLLGWSTYITVLQFGNLVGNSEGVLAAWGVMRDVANIVLLFGFIFLGVSTILNLPHSEYTAKRALPTLIIFALLLNFSLFAAEAVIDVSNALATSIYEQATGGTGVCEPSENAVACGFKKGIGGQVMTLSGITSIFTFTSNESNSGTEFGNTSQTVVVYAGLIIFAVITALVLFTAAIMLIIRAVVLAFLMVTAPIGFAGMAIPPLHGMAKSWWKELLSQAFFAPIYFLLAFMSLKMMAGIITALTPGNVATAPVDPVAAAAAAAAAASGAAAATTASTASPELANLAGVFTGGENLADVFTGGQTSNITIVMTFALLIGFMLAALMFAKKSSAHGTGIAVAGAGKLAFGTLGFVGRNTGGRVSLLAANKIANSRIGQTSIGRGLYGIANKGATSSFDFRQTAGAKKAEGAIGGLGTVRKSVQHGVHGIEEDKKKAKVDYAKKIVQSHDEIEKEEELKAESKRITNDRAAEEARSNQLGQPLQQAVTDQQQQNAQRRAADASQIAGIQADLNQAIASGDGVAQPRLESQLNIMLAANAQTTAQEDQALNARKQALQTHQQQTKLTLEGYDNRIKRINTEINGGDFEEANGTTTSFVGITTDAKRKVYGRNLVERDGRIPFTNIPYTPRFSISRHTSDEAGREVIRNAGRTGTERAIYDLQNQLNSNAPAQTNSGAGNTNTGSGAHPAP